MIPLGITRGHLVQSEDACQALALGQGTVQMPGSDRAACRFS